VLKGKASELDWALFETKIRNVVLDIIEPLNDHTEDHIKT